MGKLRYLQSLKEDVVTKPAAGDPPQGNIPDVIWWGMYPVPPGTAE